MEKKSVSRTILRFWGIGQFGNSVYTYLETAFYTVFLTDVALFPVAITSVILTLTSIAKFFIAPMMGSVINMTKPLRWGRVRSWILLGPLLMLPFSVLQYVVLGNSWGAGILMIVIYIIGHVFCQLGYTADTAIIPIVAASQADRLKMSSNRMVGSNIGRLTNSYFVPTLVSAFTAGAIVSEKMIYALLALIFSLIFCICYFIEFLMVKGYEPEGENALTKDPKLKMRDILEAFRVNPYLPPLVLADLGSNIGSFLIPTLNVYYYKYVAVDIPNVGLAAHLVIMGICGLVGAKLAGSVFKNVQDRKKLLLIIYLTVTFMCVCSRVVALRNGYMFVALQGIMQLCIGMSQPFELNLYMDASVYHEWKTGKNVTAFIMGLSALPGSLASIVKSLVISITLSAAGYVAGMQITPALQQNFANAYLIVPGTVPLISFFALLLFFKLTPEMVSSMQREIQQKKCKENA